MSSLARRSGQSLIIGREGGPRELRDARGLEVSRYRDERENHACEVATERGIEAHGSETH